MKVRDSSAQSLRDVVSLDHESKQTACSLVGSSGVPGLSSIPPLLADGDTGEQVFFLITNQDSVIQSGGD